MKLMVRTRSVDALDDSEISVDWLAVVASSGVDDRSVLPYWQQRALSAPDKTVLVRTQPREYVDYSVGDRAGVLDLRNAAGCMSLFQGQATACIDISGLAHHVW